MIEHYSSVKPKPSSSKPADMEAVDLELPDHSVDISADYDDDCIKTVIYELIGCAEHDIKIVANASFKTVHY